MDVCGLNHIFWELLSMVSLTTVGVFWLIERISTQRFAMNELMAALLAIVATFIIWIKLSLVVPAYRLDGIVDLILGAAMTLLAIHFMCLILRASRIPVFVWVERWLFAIALLAWFGYALYLFMFGTAACFVALDAWVNMFLRPFWAVALLTLFARARFGSAA